MSNPSSGTRWMLNKDDNDDNDDDDDDDDDENIISYYMTAYLGVT